VPCDWSRPPTESTSNVTTSEQINDLAAALSKAQGELQNVVKDAKNPHFKSEYATLDAITDAVRPVFAKHGLAVVQIPAFRDGAVLLDVLITHSSGQWIKGDAGAPLSKADAQGVGSATTYLRRYSLAGIAQIAQTDDDGNAAAPAVAQTKAVPLVAPKGFGQWLEDFEKVADEGLPALQKMWMDSDESFRTHMKATASKRLEELKAKASKKGKANAA
jgi:hypothetical protein